MHKVVIIQEYVPQYRAPFFELLQDEARRQGIELTVAFGEATAAQASRKDDGRLNCGVRIQQKEWKIAGRRLVVRRTADATAGSDLVILEQARRNLDAYRMLTARGVSRPLVALWGHGKDYTRRTTAAERMLSRWLTARADHFFAYTNGGRQSVVADGFPSQDVTVVQNSIDTAALRNDVQAIDPGAVSRFSQTHRLQGKTSLFIGALDSTKRLDFLEEASCLAFEIDPRYRLLVAGDGQMRSQVEAWARRNHWVTYLGPLAGESKALAMVSSQIIAMPGRVGLAAVDSFAAGLPIVTTNWPWHAPEFEYLENGRNAIIAPDQPALYASSMVELMNDAEFLHQLQASSRSDGEHFTLQEMVRRFLSGIQSALAKRVR